MGLADLVAAKQATLTGRVVGRKGFSQPPFWSQDLLRLPFLSSYGLSADREQLPNDFEGYVRQAYKQNGIIFACILARQMVFSEARFQWRQFEKGRPGDLFGTDELRLLERPWPGGTTGELLARMESVASLAGNYYATVADDRGRLGKAATGPGRRIVHIRPDWVTIVLGSFSGDLWALDTRPIGYLYEPRPFGTPGALMPPDSNAVLLEPDEIVHYSPIPDPEARFRGMSWLTPILREIQADTQSTIHKQKFLENAATPSMVIKFDRDTSEDAFEEFKEQFKAEHQGAWNAYKALMLAGGADVTPIGADFKQLEFSATQGKGESRIASAAGVPPSWVGFSEGLAGSALNAGNFNAARRRFADGTIRPLWRMAAASLETLVTPPSRRAELWYDDRDIAFLREDQADVAEIQSKQAVALERLSAAGYDPDAAVDYLAADDLTQLKGKHSGLFSVQLQPPGEQSAIESGPSEPLTEPA